MLSRTAMRMPTAANTVARRGFHSTRAQMSSPYHYPEGPRSNIPFNPLSRFFFLKYWTFMGESAAPVLFPALPTALSARCAPASANTAL